MAGRKLDIGRPSHRNDGWETCDIRPGADHLCSATNISSLGTFSELECSMVLEHLKKWEVEAAIADWYKALEPEGQLVVTVPDLIYGLRLIEQGCLDGIYLVYGGGQTEGDEDDCPEQEHRWGFTLDYLEWLFSRAGFCVVHCKQQTGMIVVRAVKIN